MSAVLFPAEVTVGPLLALSLQGYVRGSPILPSGPHSTPPSFSSSSSTDGDLDFQSPGGSQARPPGKGELAGLRLGSVLGKDERAPCPPSCRTQPAQAAVPSGAEPGVLRQEQTQGLLQGGSGSGRGGGGGSVLVTWLRRSRTTSKIP